MPDDGPTLLRQRRTKILVTVPATVACESLVAELDAKFDAYLKSESAKKLARPFAIVLCSSAVRCIELEKELEKEHAIEDDLADDIENINFSLNYENLITIKPREIGIYNLFNTHLK